MAAAASFRLLLVAIALGSAQQLTAAFWHDERVHLPELGAAPLVRSESYLYLEDLVKDGMHAMWFHAWAEAIPREFNDLMSTMSTR